MDDDLIKRETVLMMLEEESSSKFSTEEERTICHGLIYHVKGIPKVDVKQIKHARWIIFHGYNYCSECGRGFYERTPYCPGCGAEIEGTIN